MGQDGKLDLLLNMLEDFEKKREEAETRSREDMADLKVAVKARLPQVEKKVSDLGLVLVSLSSKVEQLEESVGKSNRRDKGAAEVKDEQFVASPSTPFIQGKRDHVLNSVSVFGGDSPGNSEMVGGGIAGSLLPMTCPQFNGENPQTWRANCEVYFDVYGILPANWVKIATLNFVGNAAFWLQSVRNQLIGVTWYDLCERVCARFTRDKHQSMIRQWFQLDNYSF